MKLLKPTIAYIIGFALSGTVCAQIAVPNNGFEQKDPASDTQTAFWKAENDQFLCKTDNKEFFKGKYSLKLESNTEGHHFFNQEFPFKSHGLRKFKLSCAVKTKDLDGSIILGARLFDNTGALLPKMLFKLTETKNQDWTLAEGFFVAEKEAAKIRIFGDLLGTGTAWIDEISVEELPEPTKAPSVETAMYIHEYFDIVYENSIITDKSFIAGIKSKTMQLCGDNTSKNECRYILQYFTTSKLNDKHSFFTTPEEWKNMVEGGKHPGTGENLHNFPTGKMLDNSIAYLSLPMFVSSDPDLLAKYADTLQTLISSFDKQETKGWIIDLSQDMGGNCFPMIAGIGPLIGNGVCEHSFSGNGTVRQLIYNDGWTGTAWIGGDSSLVFMKSNPYQLKYKNKPIAVIYGNNTASSGEVTALALIGLPHTKSFGQETYGVSTRVDNFELSDGSYLNLASGIDADRNKNKYGGKIKPDVETKDTETAIRAAVKWILEKRTDSR
ncbi:S41 family peptidase [Fluviicola sp.]|uniref:S41 family peptidase n=1 Tax=Fluviicola sp. TaxID=1917219 RepID=UPI0031D4DEB5